MPALFPTFQLAWSWFRDLGVHERLSLLETRQVRTVNGLALAGMVVQLVFTFLSVAAAIPAAIVINAGVLLFVCLPVPWLQARRRYFAARLLAFFAPVALGTLTGLLAARLGSAARPEVLLISFSVLAVLLFDGALRRGAFAAVVGGYVLVQVAPHLAAGGLPRTEVWTGLVNGLGAFVLSYVIAGIYKSDYVRSQGVILAQNRELAAQRSRIQAQADELRKLNEVKDRLFSIIAHDLRTPVGALQGLLAQAREAEDARHDFGPMLGHLQQHLGYTGELLDNLLHWARSQLGGFARHPERFDARDVLVTNARLFAAPAVAKRIRLDLVAGAPVAAWADRAMIDLVVRNLVSNALKFTPAGGRITLDAGVDEEGRALIRIVDTGIGMTPAQVQRGLEGGAVSERGTAGELGTGLGLMLVRDFIAANGGRLELTSAPGAGTRIAIALPATA